MAIVNAYLESTKKCSISLCDKKNISQSNFCFQNKVQINHPTQEICVNLERTIFSLRTTIQMHLTHAIFGCCCGWFTSPDYGFWSMLYVTTAYGSAHYFPVLTRLPSAAARYFRAHKGHEPPVRFPPALSFNCSRTTDGSAGFGHRAAMRGSGGFEPEHTQGCKLANNTQQARICFQLGELANQNWFTWNCFPEHAEINTSAELHSKSQCMVIKDLCMTTAYKKQQH